ncbi:MAG: extracellular solute-binding protein [Pleurocapsa minor GSE-CHR-MK-17-07R]|jgi:multiple sugar transport system substrate-binding protein|nr:extracellular solute-binding protein [Pleurocapsa minor GSE-CHR-MK 17-07R]
MSRKLSSLFCLLVVLMMAVGVTTAQEPEEFTFTGWSLNEGLSRDVILGFANTYAETNGVTINPVAFPFNEYLNQVILQANGGQLSGLMQLDVAWMAPMAALGVLKDLGADVPEGVYTDAALASCQVDGVQYGLPWTTASIGMVANQELLTAAGVTELPTTIEEFEAALIALEAYNPEVIPYAGITDVAQLKDIIPWLYTFGGQVFADDGSVALGDEGSIAAVEWYASLLERNLIAADVDRFDARQLFAQGMVGFYDDAIVARSLAAGNKPADLELTVVPLPRPVLNEGDAPQSMLWGHCVGVVDDDKAAAATAFALHLTGTPEIGIAYFEQMSLPPTTIEALASDVVANDAYVSTWSNEVTAFATANPFWGFPESARMETLLGEAVQSVMVGDASAADALADAAEEITDLTQ